MKKYTEEDLRKLIDMIDEAYRPYTRDNVRGIEILDDFLKFGFAEEKEEEKTIPITYGLIKATCGWSKWCDVTGGNHYTINEWGDYPLNEVFYITESEAKELNFI
jgi:hypothetical protein